MYDRVNSNMYGLKDEFSTGVEDFVNKSMNQLQFFNEWGIRCPCVKCVCIGLKTPSEIRPHLNIRVFFPTIIHGLLMEKRIRMWTLMAILVMAGMLMVINLDDEEQFDAVTKMVYDAIRPFVNVPGVNANMENEIVSEG